MSDDSIYKPKLMPRPGRLDVRGIDYAVTEWGDQHAPLLIFLHGFADTGSTFQFVVDALENDWHVVAPDWRGCGETRAETRAFWFPDYLADLDQLLNHYCGSTPARLVGHSMGGNIAGLYAGAFPERVSTLINLEGFGLQVTAKVLLVAGRNSGFGAPENLPYPRRQTAWIENSGHMLHFEQPAALARVIEEFLGKPST